MVNGRDRVVGVVWALQDGECCGLCRVRGDELESQRRCFGFEVEVGESG